MFPFILVEFSVSDVLIFTLTPYKLYGILVSKFHSYTTCQKAAKKIKCILEHVLSQNPISYGQTLKGHTLPLYINMLQNQFLAPLTEREPSFPISSKSIGWFLRSCDQWRLITRVLDSIACTLPGTLLVCYHYLILNHA